MPMAVGLGERPRVGGQALEGTEAEGASEGLE